MGEWKIRLVNGSAVKELLLTTEPAPTWTFGALGDVGQINVTSTRNIRIEKSPTSDVFFEYMDRFNVVGTIGKRENFLTLLYNDEPVIENSRVINLKSSKGVYSLIISGDNAKLLQLLNNSLSDLDWTDSKFEIGYNSSAQAASLASDPVANEGLIYSLCANSLNSGETPITFGTFLLPLIKVDSLFDEILSQNGIALDNQSSFDFRADSGWLSEYIQLITNYPSQIGRTLTQVATNTNSSSDGTTYVVWDSSNAARYWTTQTGAYGLTEVVSIFNIGTANLTTSVNVSDTGGATSLVFAIEHRDSSGTLLATKFPLDQSGLQEENSFSNVSDGDYFQIRYTATGVTGTIQASVNLFIEAQASELAFGDTYFFEANVPEIKQLDILNYIINKYALFVDYDTVNSTLILYDYRVLIDKFNNDNDYIDLTNYIVDVQDKEIDDTGNLAQENYLEFTNDSTVFSELGRGSYQFDNVNVANSRTAYKCPFSYSNTNGDIAVLEYVDRTGDTPQFDEIGIRIVKVEFISLYNFSRIDDIDFQTAIDSHYIELNELNADLKILTVPAKLPYTVVKKLISKSEKLAIVINYDDGNEQISGLFKLNKISQWSDKTACTLELKQIPADATRIIGLLFDDNVGGLFADDLGILI